MHTNTAGPFPHVGGCQICRAQSICNSCGDSLKGDYGRCTNGRCGKCHAAYCASGGETSPGHGFGSRGNPFAK